MLNISVKDHKFSTFKILSDQGINKIMEAFKTFQEETKSIKISELAMWELVYKIEYVKKDVGISWIVRMDSTKNSSMSYSLEVIINPIILLRDDYNDKMKYDFPLNKGNCKFLKIIEDAYNFEAKKISNGLIISFSTYRLYSMDLSVKMDIKQIKTDCTPEQLILLFNRSFIPISYQKNDKKDKDDNIFSNTYTQLIRCYDNNMLIFKQYPRHVSLEGEFLILPFRMNIKYLDTNFEYGNKKSTDESLELLSYQFCYDFLQDTVLSYFNRYLMQGEYYPIKVAAQIIHSTMVETVIKEGMINALDFINRRYGIFNAKVDLQGKPLKKFTHNIKELIKNNINPVAIPEEFHVVHIPNILHMLYALE